MNGSLGVERNYVANVEKALPAFDVRHCRCPACCVQCAQADDDETTRPRSLLASGAEHATKRNTGMRGESIRDCDFYIYASVQKPIFSVNFMCDFAHNNK